MKILKIKTTDYNDKIIEIDFVNPLTDMVMPCVIVGPNGSGKTRILDAIYSVFYHTVDYVKFSIVGVKCIEATVEINDVELTIVIDYQVGSIQRTIDSSTFAYLIDDNESNLDYFPHLGNNIAPLKLLYGIKKVFVNPTYSDESSGEYGYTSICKELDIVEKNDIVLMDCPENYGLDSARQRMLVHRLIQMSRNGTQVIIASNSMEIIRCFRGNSIKSLRYGAT